MRIHYLHAIRDSHLLMAGAVLFYMILMGRAFAIILVLSRRSYLVNRRCPA